MTRADVDHVVNLRPEEFDRVVLAFLDGLG